MLFEDDITVFELNVTVAAALTTPTTLSTVNLQSLHQLMSCTVSHNMGHVPLISLSAK
ncbi:hypothetical protein ARMGADRAFT_1016576 [Armillaria gallica]|uniref:Uncharacterized protein n=1 Tax=Armillaria gallica TaxID=47427 RepID=A0A2H3D0X7_ARMGA|nr:hypothetical protein ARMGADRAFT_1016576 [Armillaria gallica]